MTVWRSLAAAALLLLPMSCHFQSGYTNTASTIAVWGVLPVAGSHVSTTTLFSASLWFAIAASDYSPGDLYQIDSRLLQLDGSKAVIGSKSLAGQAGGNVSFTFFISTFAGASTPYQLSFALVDASQGMQVLAESDPILYLP